MHLCERLGIIIIWGKTSAGVVVGVGDIGRKGRNFVSMQNYHEKLRNTIKYLIHSNIYQ